MPDKYWRMGCRQLQLILNLETSIKIWYIKIIYKRETYRDILRLFMQNNNLWGNNMMKRIFAVALIFACILALTGCHSNDTEESENGQNYFNATVLEVHEDYILVECLDVTSGVVSSGEEAEVSTKVVSADGISELETDDNIRVVFGATEDTIPIHIGNVFAIYLLDADGNVIDDN